MTIKSLYNLNPGDAVAIKCYGYTWHKDVVLTTTERCITTKSEPEIRFKKNNGFATRKEDTGYQISIVTPEIQDDWDRREYQILIRDALQDKTVNIPFNTIKEATILLLNQNEYSKSLYLQCLKEILSSHSTSSENLRSVLQLLLRTTPN